MSPEQLEDALHQVNLGYLLDRHDLDDVQEWSSLLSLGEQQRVNFARMLLQQDVELVLIDEGTSACDIENEALLYGLLSRKVRSFVSVGHRAALQKFHSHVLWMTTPLAEGDPATATHLPMADFELQVGANV